MSIANVWKFAKPRSTGVSSTSLPAPENKIYYPALDGLRAIAVLLVFSAHYLDLPRTLYWGRVGVDIFFVLSGFLITGILYDSINRENRYSIFYKRRVLRIFPVYYLVLLLSVIAYPLFRWVLHPALWLWPVYAGNYALFIWSADARGSYEVLQATRPGFQAITWHLGHLWSLCVEEQFYLVWPLVVFSLRKRAWLRNLCLLAVVIIPLLRWLCEVTVPGQFIDLGLLYKTTPLRADSLLLGGALALAIRGAEGNYIRALLKPLAVSIGLIFVMWQLASYHTAGHLIDPVWSSVHNPLFATFTSFASAVLIATAIDPTRTLYGWLNNNFLRALGQRSYGFYVYHLLLYSIYAAIARGLSFGHKGIAGAAVAPGGLLRNAGCLLAQLPIFRSANFASEKSFRGMISSASTARRPSSPRVRFPSPEARCG